MSRRPAQARETARWAVGLVQMPEGQGLTAAALLGDGCAIEELGQTRWRYWSAAERRAMSADGTAGAEARREGALTALSEVLAAFPEAQALGCDTLAPEVGAALAEAMGLPVVRDFAAADRELGGRGRPMDAFFHHALLRSTGLRGASAVLVLDRVCRLTWADADQPDPAAPGACLAFDIGPGQAEAGYRLTGGRVSEPLIEAATQALWFRQLPPKWLTGQSFPELGAALAQLDPADAAATTRSLIAVAALIGLSQCPAPPQELLVAGPGRRDSELLQLLEAGFEGRIRTVEAAGLDGEALTAQACAWLALRVLAGLPSSGPGTTGVAASVGGGRVSRPGGDRRDPGN
ncbi:anhydro-N-acetylmuramic acid kinase [Frigidibacter sp. ROC022]|uniref:anhydro-N-acetylmuramic acid kinase n=1 Tax=Frigidibacter sp. ROC022 TaxID=2971796 RepID=UPI00215B47DD|nr:anhydro-N-acetylmuramic acid kinase [Frigidibacter sp. ROC022]MCR8723749.1 anhydro-N-acetylmuramic acid kinase [Frigidibacter sp. ROC022]